MFYSLNYEIRDTETEEKSCPLSKTETKTDRTSLFTMIARAEREKNTFVYSIKTRNSNWFESHCFAKDEHKKRDRKRKKKFVLTMSKTKQRDTKFVYIVYKDRKGKPFSYSVKDENIERKRKRERERRTPLFTVPATEAARDKLCLQCLHLQVVTSLSSSTQSHLTPNSQRERESVCMCVCMCVIKRVCVCVWVREAKILEILKSWARKGWKLKKRIKRRRRILELHLIFIHFGECCFLRTGKNVKNVGNA